MSSTWSPEQLDALRGLQEDLRREFWERLTPAGAAPTARSAEGAAEASEGPGALRGAA